MYGNKKEKHRKWNVKFKVDALSIFQSAQVGLVGLDVNILNPPPHPHPWPLLARDGWSLMSTCRFNHRHILICKAILGLFPSYFLLYILQKTWEVIVFTSGTYSYCLFRKSVLRKMPLHVLLPLIGSSCKIT